MKNNYLLLSLFFISSLSFSQEEYCGTKVTSESLNYFNSIKKKVESLEKQFLSRSKSSINNSVITSIPIKAHIIRTSSGYGGLTVNQLNDAIDIVNNYYINAGLIFFLCDGINYIDDSSLFDFNVSDETSLLASNNIDNTINIYFANSVTSSSGSSLCGYAYFPGGPEIIIMKNSCTTNGSTLSHEIGHFFGIYHTHQGYGSTQTAELVDGSNCSVAGDFICDTPADPRLGNSNVSTDCTYTGFDRDANFEPFTPNTKNIMSYSRKSCRTEFSTQQYARINAVYHATRSNLNCPSFNADFIADVTEICDATSLTVNFSDNSVGATSWSWDVNGDNIEDYSIQNPTHTYTNKNDYNISLTISDGNNSITKVKNNYIKVGAKEANTTSINLTINLDGDPSEISWKFFDENNQILDFGENYLNNADEYKTINKTFTVNQNKCYKFEIYDSYGDGLRGEGYTLKSSDGNIIASGGIFSHSESQNIYTGTILNTDDFTQNQFKIFPNPTSSNLKIVNLTNSFPDILEINNSLGQLIITKRITSHEDLNVDISKIKEGVYYLKLKKNNKSNVYSFIKK